MLLIERNPDACLRDQRCTRRRGDHWRRSRSGNSAAAGAPRADVVVAVTGEDEDNLVICQIAKEKFHVARTIARVNNPKNENLFRMLGVDVTVSQTNYILNLIEQAIPERSFVHLLSLSRGSSDRRRQGFGQIRGRPSRDRRDRTSCQHRHHRDCPGSKLDRPQPGARSCFPVTTSSPWLIRTRRTSCADCLFEQSAGVSRGTSSEDRVMLLAVEIGNTNTSFGFFAASGDLTSSYRFSTQRDRMPDEWFAHARRPPCL